MTLEQEFKNQWTSLCNYIKSEILKSNPDNFDLNRIQSTLDGEKKKYFLPGQYNYAWLEKLKKTNPDVASVFEETLRHIKLEPVFVKKDKSSLFLVILAIIGAILGFGASRIFHTAVLMTILITAFGAAIGLLIGATISSKKKSDILNKLCESYTEQLTKAGEKLSLILAQTD